MLELLADITLNATFPQNEVSLYQQNRIQSLRQAHSQSSFLAAEKIAKQHQWVALQSGRHGRRPASGPYRMLTYAIPGGLRRRDRGKMIG